VNNSATTIVHDTGVVLRGIISCMQLSDLIIFLELCEADQTAFLRFDYSAFSQ